MSSASKVTPGLDEQSLLTARAELARTQGLLFVPPSMIHTESDDWSFCAPIVLDYLVDAVPEGRIVAAYERRSDLERACVRLPGITHGVVVADADGRLCPVPGAEGKPPHLVLALRKHLHSHPALLDQVRMMMLDRLPLPRAVSPGCGQAEPTSPRGFVTHQLPEGVAEFGSLVEVYLQRRAPGPFTLAVLDARLTNRPYGRWFLRAIPWMPRTYEVAAIEDHMLLPAPGGEGSRP